MALKRFAGNKPFDKNTVSPLDIFPFTHLPGEEGDEDGKINLQNLKEYFTDDVMALIPETANPENKLVTQKEVTDINTEVSEIKKVIPEQATEENKLATQQNISDITKLIPEETTEENQLTNKSYVDESIQTNTAVNRGAFNTYADLIAYSGTVTRNDYATVGNDETHNHECWRYKWNDETKKWTPEYKINESPMTQEQLNAINSGITSEKIQSINNSISSIGESIGDIRDEIDLIQEDIESAVKANGTIANKDLNNFKTAGMWRAISNVANLPPDMDSSYGQLLVMSGDDESYPTQIFSVEGDDNNDLWYRKYDGSSWSSWTKVLTKNNFSFNPSTGVLSINM